jgi:hypothetical protein
MTVIRRCNNHFRVLQLDGVYVPGRDGGSPIFHPAPTEAPKPISRKTSSLGIWR